MTWTTCCATRKRSCAARSLDEGQAVGAGGAYIRAEVAYLRNHNRAAGDAFLVRIAKARRTLGRFSDVGFVVGTPPIAGVRRLVLGDYLMDYEPTADGLVILAIRHGAQRPIAIEGPGDDFDYED